MCDFSAVLEEHSEKRFIFSGKLSFSKFPNAQLIFHWKMCGTQFFQMEKVNASYVLYFFVFSLAQEMSSFSDIFVLKTELVNPEGTALGPKSSKHFRPDTFIVYCDAEKQPLFFSFDLNSNNPTSPKKFTTTLLPTIYAIEKSLSIVWLSFLTFPEVITKLKNGADFMIAGATISVPLLEYIKSNPFEKDFMFAVVRDIETNSAMAVGKVLMSSEELLQKFHSDGDKKGRLLEVIHVVGDGLWSLGDHAKPAPTKLAAPDVNLSEKIGENDVDKGDMNVVGKLHNMLLEKSIGDQGKKWSTFDFCFKLFIFR